MDENAVEVIATRIINGKIKELWDDKVGNEVCFERHKEVRMLRGMVWAVIILQLTILGSNLLRG